MKNEKFNIEVNDEGIVSQIAFNDDAHIMNWVVDEQYLKKAGYHDAEKDKLFGNFEIIADGVRKSSEMCVTTVERKEEVVTVVHEINSEFEVIFTYDVTNSQCLEWGIELKNSGDKEIVVADFGVWMSLAYVMYRENNLELQTNHSAAVIPSISKNFTKIACVRRSNVAPHLGIFQTAGQAKSVGTYCCYENKFFENVSPSLDGILFHKLILAGGYPEGFENADWIYDKDGFTVAPKTSMNWTYMLDSFSDQADFYKLSAKYNHPVFDNPPMAVKGMNYSLSFSITKAYEDVSVSVSYLNDELKLIHKDITNSFTNTDDNFTADLDFDVCGEHKITLKLDNQFEDIVVINVVKPISETITNRVKYLSEDSYSIIDLDFAHVYEPVSNQGESLGKLSLILMKNLLGDLNKNEVREVEASCVYYIRPKWFENGDFKNPTYLYGDESFYRCMDFEYIAHVFYLLSLFDPFTLQLSTPDTYLEWAAEVFSLRVDVKLHQTERGIEEAQMLGVYFLYVDDLLQELKKRGLKEKHMQIKRIWEERIAHVVEESVTLKAAVTEHFYDNAGFGPATGALANGHELTAARTYAELLIANIGYSNDFRSQNPDRWWEALSYMTHSLWGGITAASALIAYEKIKDIRLLKAAYRATVAMLYCYDDAAKATNKRLLPGEAASTYSVAGPHLNRPDLSRNRFGQSTFFKDGGIFAKLFTGVDSTDDWDMGEELVAYLAGFGQKTFLYLENGKLNVINGSLKKIADGYEVVSFAPYCRSYHFYEIDEHFVSCDGDVPRIKLVNNKFEKL